MNSATIVLYDYIINTYLIDYSDILDLFDPRLLTPSPSPVGPNAAGRELYMEEQYSRKHFAEYSLYMIM
jgi:hypothetical protein